MKIRKQIEQEQAKRLELTKKIREIEDRREGLLLQQTHLIYLIDPTKNPKYQEEMRQLKKSKEIFDRLVKNSNKHYKMLLEERMSTKTARTIYATAETMQRFFKLPKKLQQSVESGDMTLREAFRRSKRG